MSNVYRIDDTMTDEAPAVTERAVKILISEGWNVEYVPGWGNIDVDINHAYCQTLAFGAAFIDAVQKAKNELAEKLTVAECATMYGKAIATVTKACRERRIVATKPGREYRIDRASAEAYWGRRRR